MDLDEDVLETILTRKEILQGFAEEPRHRRELEEAFDISKTTCHRIIRSFDENGLVRRTDDGYGLSQLGMAVTEQVEEFERNVRSAYQLEPLLDTFESADVDFDVELFADATITRPQPENPSPPINRYLELFQEAETIRTLDRASFIPPLYVEEILTYGIEVDGGGIAIYPKSVIETRHTEYADIHREIYEEGLPLRYRIHDDVPFGMNIYGGDHVGLRAYDDETGNLLLFADTDDPDAIAWAMDVFEHYYEESKPPSAFDDLPDWIPESEIHL